MKPYPSLTQRGKQRRMLQLAYHVLGNYDLQVGRISFLTLATNLIYKVVTSQGEKLALRFYSDKDSSLEENRAELFFLHALAQHPELKVIQPVLRKDGEMINITHFPGTPPGQRCALFRWIPGRPMAEQISPENYRRLGEAMARLHNLSASLRLPPEIQPKRWDKVFYYPDEKAIYALPEYRHLFDAQRIRLLDQAIHKLDAFLPTLYARGEAPILIHGDLHPWNVHVHRGQLYLLDFEDMISGYPLQDVAITLYYRRNRADYPALAAAFRQGYTRLREWPARSEEELRLLMAARTANFINYVAEIDPNAAGELPEMFTRLEEFLEEKPSPRC